jgi:hypothetical protein
MPTRPSNLEMIVMLSSTHNPDSKKISNSRLDEIKIELDWISSIQEQVDFLNSKGNPPDFEIFFKVRLRRSAL